jgi:diguanylate cyclase (GGDEF)-like protein
MPWSPIPWLLVNPGTDMNPSPAPDATLIDRLQAQLRELRGALQLSRQREAAAEQAARIDPLTGLANRRLLEHRMAQQIDRAAGDRPLTALLFIDLDGFKAINDRHGHAIGDALLRLVGLRLRHAMRRDDLACRIGGDEFVCVLPRLAHGDELPALETKLRTVVSQPCQLAGLSLQVQTSIGSALYPRDGLTLAELLAHADRAMYRRKTEGRSAADQPRSLAAAQPNSASHQPCVTP